MESTADRNLFYWSWQKTLLYFVSFPCMSDTPLQLSSMLDFCIPDRQKEINLISTETPQPYLWDKACTVYASSPTTPQMCGLLDKTLNLSLEPHLRTLLTLSTQKRSLLGKTLGLRKSRVVALRLRVCASNWKVTRLHAGAQPWGGLSHGGTYPSLLFKTQGTRKYNA